LLEGVGGLADLPGNLIAGTDKLGKYIADHIRKLFGAAPSTAAMDYTNPATAAASQAADAMNLPSAATPGERVYAAGVRAVPSAALNPSAPVTGIVSSMASGAAAQGVQEAGGNKATQLAAALAAGGITAVPAIGKRGVQTLLGIDPEVAQQNLANAEAAGASPTLGMAAGPGTNAQVIEKGLSMVPWAGGIVRSSIERSNRQAAQVVSDIADNLGAGQGPQATGAMVQNSLRTGALPSINKSVDAAYKARAAAVPDGTTVDLSNTLSKIQEMAKQSPMFADYVQGSDLFKWLESKLQTSATAGRWVNVGGQKAWLTQDNKLLPTPPATGANTQLPFQDADTFQRELHQLTDYSYLTGDVTSMHNGALAQIGKAATQDISSTLKAIPGAASADKAVTCRLSADH